MTEARQLRRPRSILERSLRLQTAIWHALTITEVLLPEGGRPMVRLNPERGELACDGGSIVPPAVLAWLSSPDESVQGTVNAIQAWVIKLPPPFTGGSFLEAARRVYDNLRYAVEALMERGVLCTSMVSQDSSSVLLMVDNSLVLELRACDASMRSRMRSRDERLVPLVLVRDGRLQVVKVLATSEEGSSAAGPEPSPLRTAAVREPPAPPPDPSPPSAKPVLDVSRSVGVVGIPPTRRAALDVAAGVARCGVGPDASAGRPAADPPPHRPRSHRGSQTTGPQTTGPQVRTADAGSQTDALHWLAAVLGGTTTPVTSLDHGPVDLHALRETCDVYKRLAGVAQLAKTLAKGALEPGMVAVPYMNRSADGERRKACSAEIGSAPLLETVETRLMQLLFGRCSDDGPEDEACKLKYPHPLCAYVDECMPRDVPEGAVIGVVLDTLLTKVLCASGTLAFPAGMSKEGLGRFCALLGRLISNAIVDTYAFFSCDTYTTWRDLLDGVTMADTLDQGHVVLIQDLAEALQCLRQARDAAVSNADASDAFCTPMPSSWARAIVAPSAAPPAAQGKSTPVKAPRSKQRRR